MKIRTARPFLSIIVEMLPSPTADRLQMNSAERFLTENVAVCQSRSADRSVMRGSGSLGLVGCSLSFGFFNGFYKSYLLLNSKVFTKAFASKNTI